MLKSYTEICADLLAADPGARWIAEAAALSDARLEDQSHGHLEEYRGILKQLGALAASGNRPSLEPAAQTGAVSIPAFSGIPKDSAEAGQLRALLWRLKPWRKGPWNFGPVSIDTEWRSDLKWDRLLPYLDEFGGLAGQRVLDVGCGSGYHLWRIVEAGARVAVGVEPFLLSVAQFFAGAGERQPAAPFMTVFPLSLEESPALPWFDTVFSMGVLAHAKSPFDHLAELRRRMRPGAKLVLETLVIDGEPGQVLVPKGRYAKMRNVWFVPSAAELCGWLERAGYKSPRILDVTPTTSTEQRRTEWMDFESLGDFLDPDDPTKTIEGYPAPIRGMLVADNPA